jgi:hypothetical protein
VRQLAGMYLEVLHFLLTNSEYPQHIHRQSEIASFLLGLIKVHLRLHFSCFLSISHASSAVQFGPLLTLTCLCRSGRGRPNAGSVGAQGVSHHRGLPLPPAKLIRPLHPSTPTPCALLPRACTKCLPLGFRYKQNSLRNYFDLENLSTEGSIGSRPPPPASRGRSWESPLPIPSLGPC